MFTSVRKLCSSLLTKRHIYFSSDVCGRSISQAEAKEGYIEHTSKSGLRYVIRPMVSSDISKLIDLGRLTLSIYTEPCLHSWIEADPLGIKIALMETGELAGSCSNVINGDRDEDGICFGGAFLVQKKFQGQGIGPQLLKECCKHIGNRNCGLNCIAGNQVHNLFVSEGFHIQEDRFTTVEYYTTSWPLDFSSFSSIPPSGVEIFHFEQSHLPKIFAYDEKIVGFSRKKNMTLNILQKGSQTLVAIGGGGTLVGFGTVKKTMSDAVRIGPLYADSPDVAEVLLRRLCEVPEEGKGFTFATTSANSAAQAWMRRLDVGKRREGIRLYTKQRLDADLGKVFAQFDIAFAPF